MTDELNNKIQAEATAYTEKFHSSNSIDMEYLAYLAGTQSPAMQEAIRAKVIEEVKAKAQRLIEIFKAVDPVRFPTMVIRKEALEDFINDSLKP